MEHAIKEQERISKNILSMYSNSNTLTTKELSVDEFQKSYPIEDFSVITADIMKSYISDVIEKAGKDEYKDWSSDDHRKQASIHNDKYSKVPGLSSKNQEIRMKAKAESEMHQKEAIKHSELAKQKGGEKGDALVKSEIIKETADEINSYEKIIVKAENGAKQLFYVKDKSKIVKAEDEDYSKWTSEQHIAEAKKHDDIITHSGKSKTEAELSAHDKLREKHLKFAKEKSSK